MLAGNLVQSIGLFARFEKQCLGREEAYHRSAFLGAPVEIEGDGDGTDLSDCKQRLEMLGAAAAGLADQTSFADALSEKIIFQPIGAFVEFAEPDRSVRVDDGAFVGKVLRVARK